jgi:hypothetical protein
MRNTLVAACLSALVVATPSAAGPILSGTVAYEAATGRYTYRYELTVPTDSAPILAFDGFFHEPWEGQTQPVPAGAWAGSHSPWTSHRRPTRVTTMPYPGRTFARSGPAASSASTTSRPLTSRPRREPRRSRERWPSG